MAARPTWKGYLKISLVSIPIKVFPATARQSDVSFRLLHRTCQTPIQQKRWCPVHDVEVGPDELVRGWEASKGQFVADRGRRPRGDRTARHLAQRSRSPGS